MQAPSTGMQWGFWDVNAVGALLAPFASLPLFLSGSYFFILLSLHLSFFRQTDSTRSPCDAWHGSGWGLRASRPHTETEECCLSLQVPWWFCVFTVWLFATKLTQREVWDVGMCLYVSQILIFRYIHNISLCLWILLPKYQVLIIYLDFEANSLNSLRMQVTICLLFRLT